MPDSRPPSLRSDPIGPMISPPDPILSIQYLRAAAALCVVAAHAGGVLVLQAGVDVFFVISGFIMWTITRTPQTPARFLRNRLLRIVPLYWIATALMAWHQHAPAVAVVRSLLFIPYVGEQSEIWPVLVQGWTLSYEILFYALVAAVLPLRRGAGLAVLLGGLGLLVAAGLLAAPRDAVLRTCTSPLLVEFAFGIALAELRRAGRLPAAPAALALAALALLLFWMPGFEALPRAGRALVWGVPAAGLVLGVLALDQAGWIGRDTRLLRLGDASYAIYLFQSFPMRTLLALTAPMPAPLRVGVTVACIAALGLAISTWIERPLLALLRRGPTSRLARGT